MARNNELRKCIDRRIEREKMPQYGGKDQGTAAHKGGLIKYQGNFKTTTKPPPGLVAQASHHRAATHLAQTIDLLVNRRTFGKVIEAEDFA
jgi:hypothetical protein